MITLLCRYPLLPRLENPRSGAASLVLVRLPLPLRTAMRRQRRDGVLISLLLLRCLQPTLRLHSSSHPVFCQTSSMDCSHHINNHSNGVSRQKREWQ